MPFVPSENHLLCHRGPDIIPQRTLESFTPLQGSSQWPSAPHTWDPALFPTSSGFPQITFPILLKIVTYFFFLNYFEIFFFLMAFNPRGSLQRLRWSHEQKKTQIFPLPKLGRKTQDRSPPESGAFRWQRAGSPGTKTWAPSSALGNCSAPALCRRKQDDQVSRSPSSWIHSEFEASSGYRRHRQEAKLAGKGT